MDISKYRKKLEKLGLKKNENISDFWFLKKNEIISKNNFLEADDNLDELSLIIRWESEIGKVFKTELLKFIQQIQEENIQLRNEASKKGIYSFIFADINFINFNFKYKNIVYDSFDFCKLFDTSQIFGFCDFRGIELKNISINDSILRNGCFSLSNFSNSNFQQVELDNINFVKANFINSRLVSIKFVNNSTLSGANLTNAFINAISLTNNILGDGVQYNKISYLQLLKKTIGVEKTNRNHTELLFLDTKSITNYELFEFKNYGEWYMKVSRLIRESKFDLKKKTSILFQIIISKYWTSYRVFGFTTIITILLLSIIFNSISDNFTRSGEIKTFDFIDSIYFVVVTFTTLGYGDISPHNHLGQIFVILTSLIGYLFLAIFIYLLSKKIGN